MTQAIEQRVQDLITMAKLVPPSSYSIEPQLIGTKHFAYRFMSPLQATIEFGNAYNRATKAYLRSSVDCDLAENTKGKLWAAPAVADKEFTHLWKARVTADHFLLPYDRYIAWCLDFAGRRTRKKMPRPNQLGPSNNTAVAWIPEMTKFMSSYADLYFMNLELPPQYRIENYSGLPPQVNFRQTLIGYLDKSPTPYHDQLAKWSYSKRVMESDQLLGHKSEEIRKEAADLLKRNLDDGRAGFPEPEAEQILARSEMLPSCFGVPYAQAPLAHPCASCSLKNVCRKAAEIVSSQAGLDPASVDPDADRTRTLTRIRAATFRKRKTKVAIEATARNATKSSSYYLS